MNCEQISPINASYFGKKDNAKNDNQLNFGVVVPPDKLPNSNLYEDLFASQKASTKAQKKVVAGGKKMTAGRLSAHLAFASMILGALAFLPFIRKH